eukprot:CAMPEP_0172037464 /NCGR_PEP_ID=MMETSP1041-20130122/22763_1 /TAXON_ID=464988 /ORGANISM="Hemiselmis andersenii, Strain CCMP439" /LENGTH=78 /DNA_ID=CAMNT_0012694865 /DNA_START=187 /DNA_END=421 /DNA_ORIENTATION=-
MTSTEFRMDVEAQSPQVAVGSSKVNLAGGYEGSKVEGLHHRGKGEDGQPGHACHILPVAKGPFGTLEQRRDLLKSLGQ